jgi:pimeloyl-ACP methyl ester carboxylesterase
MRRIQHPIVLVHGLIGGLDDPRITASFPRAEVHTPDLIGYGELQQAGGPTFNLEAQAEHVASYISSLGTGLVHLVGHSVGGAVAVLVANRYPQLIASLTSIEGNFTLKDAFWSSQLAQMSLSDVEAIVAGYRQNPADWMASAGVPVSDWTLSLARAWLENQPATTIKAQAIAVVEATRPEAYLETIRKLMRSELRVNLIAGARSADDWDVPDWANRLCSMRVNIEGVGHLMMAESPDRFAASILACVEQAERSKGL